MREHEIFRVGMRIVGLILLTYFILSIPTLIVIVWSALHTYTTARPEFEQPMGVFRAAIDLLLDIAEYLIALYVGWRFLFHGEKLLRRVYPGSVTASATA